MEYSGAGGKLIHEKNQKQKILWHCPFKDTFELMMSEHWEGRRVLWCIRKGQGEKNFGFLSIFWNNN